MAIKAREHDLVCAIVDGMLYLTSHSTVRWKGEKETCDEYGVYPRSAGTTTDNRLQRLPVLAVMSRKVHGCPSR